MSKKGNKYMFDCIVTVGKFNRGVILKIFNIPKWCDEIEIKDAIKEIEFLSEPGLYYANIVLEDDEYINFDLNENIKPEWNKEITLYNFKFDENGDLVKIY